MIVSTKHIPDSKYYHFTESISKIRIPDLKIGEYPVSDKSWIDIGEFKKNIKQRWTPKTGQWLRCELLINMSPQGGHHDKAKTTQSQFKV